MTVQFKLNGTGRIGSDVLFPDRLDIDEARMSVWIPYADGNRRDGQGDLLEVSGIRFDRHRSNPVSLFDHGKSVALPIGKVEDPDTGEYASRIDAAAKTAWDNIFFYQGKGLPGVERRKEYDHAVFCEQVYDLVCKKFLRAGSIGYQVIKAYPLQPDYAAGTPQGMHLLEVLKLESSVVVVPANADTVRKALTLPRICGKPLSPYLVKSLAPYAVPRASRKAQMGWEPKKSIGKDPAVDAGYDAGMAAHRAGQSPNDVWLAVAGAVADRTPPVPVDTGGPVPDYPDHRRRVITVDHLLADEIPGYPRPEGPRPKSLKRKSIEEHGEHSQYDEAIEHASRQFFGGKQPHRTSDARRGGSLQDMYPEHGGVTHTVSWSHHDEPALSEDDRNLRDAMLSDHFEEYGHPNTFVTSFPGTTYVTFHRARRPDEPPHRYTDHGTRKSLEAIRAKYKAMMSRGEKAVRRDVVEHALARGLRDTDGHSWYDPASPHYGNLRVAAGLANPDGPPPHGDRELHRAVGLHAYTHASQLLPVPEPDAHISQQEQDRRDTLRVVDHLTYHGQPHSYHPEVIQAAHAAEDMGERGHGILHDALKEHMADSPLTSYALSEDKPEHAGLRTRKLARLITTSRPGHFHPPADESADGGKRLKSLRAKYGTKAKGPKSGEPVRGGDRFRYADREGAERVGTVTWRAPDRDDAEDLEQPYAVGIENDLEREEYVPHENLIRREPNP